jgi:putative ABC transport system permease protein
MKRSLRSWLWRVPIEQEVEEELALHVEMRRREGKALDSHEIEHVRGACLAIARQRDRQMRLMQRLAEIQADVRFAWRQLRKAPGFTFVAALTLALGIGANSAIFALVDATLLHPVPFDEPDRLVMVYESLPQFPRAGVSSRNFDDWESRNRTFESMAGVFTYARRVKMPDGAVEEIPAQQVTHRFFDVLRVRPIIGRTFRPDDKALPPNVTVISERLWRNRFGGDPAIVGRQLRVDELAVTVLGVVPAEFQFSAEADLWTVWHELPGMEPRGLRFLSGFGRLKPGVSIETAQSDMSAIAAALREEYPDVNRDRGATVYPMAEVLVGPGVRRNSQLFLGVVGFVLLMCCANVANLLLARMSSRARELAIRSSLGAGRGRIVTQIMTESLVLALLGGALGMGVGYAILQAAPSLLPPGLLPPSVALAFDGRVVAFCAATSLVVGVLFGLAPTWQSTGTRLVQVLASEGRGATKAGGRFRSVLVVAEVATAVLLLCGAGLLLRSLAALGDVDGGARAGNPLTMQVALSYGLPQSRHKTLESMANFYRDVERDVAQLPGVRNAGWGSGLPLGGVFYSGFNVTIEGQPGETAVNRPAVDYMIVSPGYLDALGVRVISGRGLDERDGASTTPVALVSSDFVSKHLSGRSPIGVRVTVAMIGLARVPPVAREIVGVVEPIRPSPDAQDSDQLYVPQTQNPWANSVLVVRPRDGIAAASLAPSVQAAIARIDPEQPVTRVRTLDEVAWQTIARPRFRATLVATFAGLALLLAMVGVFGVLAYSVQQRWREFGVRIALGASAGHVIGIVGRAAVGVVGVGLVVGLLAAMALARFISSFLFGVQPWDVVTFGAVTAVLALTGAVAALAPAFRAARVDPVIAFRND